MGANLWCSCLLRNDPPFPIHCILQLIHQPFFTLQHHHLPSATWLDLFCSLCLFPNCKSLTTTPGARLVRFDHTCHPPPPPLSKLSFLRVSLSAASRPLETPLISTDFFCAPRLPESASSPSPLHNPSNFRQGGQQAVTSGQACHKIGREFLIACVWEVRARKAWSHWARLTDTGRGHTRKGPRWRHRRNKGDAIYTVQDRWKWILWSGLPNQTFSER